MLACERAITCQAYKLFDEVNALHAFARVYPQRWHFMPSIPFLRRGDFMETAVSSGAVHLNLKKR
ncbi:hypothetical protein DXC69_14620 [Paenibacillus polymyxa]|nr:hypothetical protein DXC69_14620 [Paenibacillus polymyxa]